MTPPPSRAFAPLDFAQLIAIAVIWGVNNIAAKIAVDAFPPLMVVAIRFAIVLIVLFPWLKPLPPAAVKPMAAMVLLVGPVHFGIQYFGLSLAHDLAPMVVAMQLWVPFSVLFAALVLKEPIGGLRIAGILCAFVGVASMSFDPVVFAQVGALALIALSSAGYSLGTVLVRHMPRVDAWAMQAWLALVTAPIMGLASLMFETGQVEAATNASWVPWACLLFSAIASSLIANYFMFRLVQIYEVSRTTPFLLLSPLIAFVLSALILGDHITTQIAIGAGATLIGVLLVALAERRFRALG
jgi:O-acetylserine/cysteine efflux transporter